MIFMPKLTVEEKEIKKILYEPPTIQKENNPFFMFDVMTRVGGKKIICKQCSSCHSCR